MRARSEADRGATPDERFMRRALELARRGKPHPNPFVGAVVVRQGRIVGEGWHRRRGQDHAEVEALRQAGTRARGATIYVTLEPCNHHGLTPPCSAAILDSGIRRVVVAGRDRDPRVRGRGLARMRRADLDVETGLLAAEADALNVAYNHFQRTGLPLVDLKLAVTLDGRLALAGGDSRWITGLPARRAAHEMRAAADAVLVGAGTVRHDDPELTVRLKRGAHPVRVVVSGRLDLPAAARLFRDGKAPTWILTTVEAAQGRRASRLVRPGVEIFAVPGPARSERISLERALRFLALRGVRRVLVEGGASLATEFLAGGWADRLTLHMAPLILGGEQMAWVGPLGVRSIATGLRVAKWQVETLGKDLSISGDVVAPGPRTRRRSTGTRRPGPAGR